MAKYILTVTLNPVLDYMAKPPRFSLGHDSYLPEFALSAGGKGLNVSRALKSFHVPTRATGFIGGAAGSLIGDMLSKENIRHDFIKIPQETRKSITIIDLASSPITRVIEEGPTVSPASQKLFLRKFRSLLTNGRWAVMSGRLPAGIPESFYGDLINMAQARGLKTVLDTTGKFFQIGLQSSPFLIKPNREEAESFLGRKLNHSAQIKNAMQHFLKFGVKIVLISLGAKGAAATDGKDYWLAKASQVKVTNTVGCGDAMIAGFLYSYDRGQDLAQSLKTAVAAGTANCLSLRPGEIDRKQVLTLMKRVKLQRLK